MRLKIRGYYSTTTSSEAIRRNTRALQDLLAQKGIHLRPDFVVRLRISRTICLLVNCWCSMQPWTPIDVDMDKATRDALFERVRMRMNKCMRTY
jgi:hypothetical protein